MGDTLISHAARKAALRRQLRQARTAIPQAQRHAAARRATRVLLRELPPRSRIAIYLSVRSELSTTPLRAALARAGHRVSVPLTLRDWRLRFVPLERKTVLCKRGPLQLPEPVSRRHLKTARAFDVILVPLLGFDAGGGRLGNGGGYYDRALAGSRIGRKPRRIGYAYALQEVGELPIEAFDVRLDAVVTERGLRRFSQRQTD
ncbi:MAG: 5-formyltetrahydrofolate cyclo-ligase [Nevskia sp.]|nr:5-formyltetrahydrofolate cyclo-ligase [Nevskia sp.]